MFLFVVVVVDDEVVVVDDVNCSLLIAKGLMSKFIGFIANYILFVIILALDQDRHHFHLQNIFCLSLPSD